MKKALVLILSVLMLASLFVSCGKAVDIYGRWEYVDNSGYGLSLEFSEENIVKIGIIAGGNESVAGEYAFSQSGNDIAFTSDGNPTSLKAKLSGETLVFEGADGKQYKMIKK